MAIKAINLAKTINYQSDNDPDKGTEAATTWLLGTLDARVVSHIKDKATAIPVSSLGTGEGFATLRINEMNFDIVRYGLRGVTNYDVKFGTENASLGGKTYPVASAAFMDSIPEEEIAAMASAILDINQVSQEERKNSEE
jgi:hypothetical protein